MQWTQHDSDILVDEVVECKESIVGQKELIVHNDDVNTFDHVINCLIEVCGHEPVQAEQCTWIIHYNGKCAVKRGELGKLRSMCTALHDRGLSADIMD